MKRPKEDKEREDRIAMEIVVDAYGKEERAMGWYYYAEDNLAFPFKARCVMKRATSPLKIGEEVRAVAMGEADDCGEELMVSIQWRDARLTVPLIQLEASAPNAKTREVMADWKYWVERGYGY